MIKPFQLTVPQDVLDDLERRLAHARIPEAISEYGWEQGIEPGYLKNLLDYWRTDFNWRRQEALVNEMQHFTALVEDQQLHFVHAKSPYRSASPIMILHGWPGSFFEFYKLIPMLTNPEAHGGTPNSAFHVVAPSLPGYGFSPAPTSPGADCRRMAGWLHGLMTDVLGYERFYLQGGDWGSVIASWIAFDYPDSVEGLHLNMAGLRPHIGEGAPPLSEEEQAFLKLARKKRSEDFGYQAIQGTRPQTLGTALNDSPAGLAAWIVEKFHAWSDNKGDLETRITRDEILTNLMIYWVSGCITSSMRLYYEFKHNEGSLGPGQRVEVPTAFADFPAEILRPPRSWVERSYNIVHWSKMPWGGHFAALEAPELLVADIRSSF